MFAEASSAGGNERVGFAVHPQAQRCCSNTRRQTCWYESNSLKKYIVLEEISADMVDGGKGYDV